MGRGSLAVPAPGEHLPWAVTFTCVSGCFPPDLGWRPRGHWRGAVRSWGGFSQGVGGWGGREGIAAVVQSLSRTQLFVSSGTAALQASLSLTISWSLLKLTSIASVMPSNHLILVSPSPPTLNLSQYRGLFQRIDSPHNKGTLDYNSGVCKPHIHGDLVDLSEGLLTRGREDGLDCVRAIIWAGPHGTVTERSWSRSGRAETLKSWRRLS